MPLDPKIGYVPFLGVWDPKLAISGRWSNGTQNGQKRGRNRAIWSLKGSRPGSQSGPKMGPSADQVQTPKMAISGVCIELGPQIGQIPRLAIWRLIVVQSYFGPFGNSMVWIPQNGLFPMHMAKRAKGP